MTARARRSRPTTRRPRSPGPSPPANLSEAIVGYENARERCAAAEKVLERNFLRDIEMFVGDGKPAEALAVVRSIPEIAANTKFLAIRTLLDYYPELAQFGDEPASYDSARARSLVTFQRAKRAMDEAEAHMDALLMPRAREALAAGDVETLENFRSMIPHGRSYGRIGYMISDLRKKTVDDESLGQEFTVRM